MGPKLTAAEGFILCVDAEMFIITGPVMVSGLVYWIMTLF
jgi:hypothetical protein